MSNQMRRRLMMDYKNIKNDPPPGIEARPNPENISEWDCIILGPIGTIFEDGVYRLKMEFKDEYPINPPVLRFITKMFHPNIYANGDICLDILQKRWLPSYTITSILTSLQSLLDDPNCDSPANAEAAELFQKNRAEYNRRVSEVVMNSLLFNGKLTKKQERKLEHMDRSKIPYLEDLNVSDCEKDLLSDSDDDESDETSDTLSTGSEKTSSKSFDQMECDMSGRRPVGRPPKRTFNNKKSNNNLLESLKSHDLNDKKKELISKFKALFDKKDFKSMEKIVIGLVEENDKLSKRLEDRNSIDFDELESMPKFRSDFSEVFEKINSLSMDNYLLESENKRLMLEVEQFHDKNIKRLEPLLEKPIKCFHCHNTFTYCFDEDEKFNIDRFEKMSKSFNKKSTPSTGNVCCIPVVENGQISTVKKSSFDEDINDGKRVTEEWLKKIKHSQKSTKPYHMLISDRQRKNRNIKMLKAMYRANAGNKIDPETIDYIINETGYEGKLKFSISIEELSPIIMHHKFSNRGLFALKALIDGKAGWKVFPTRQQITSVRADTFENILSNSNNLENSTDNNKMDNLKTSKSVSQDCVGTSENVDCIEKDHT